MIANAYFDGSFRQLRDRSLTGAALGYGYWINVIGVKKTHSGFRLQKLYALQGSGVAVMLDNDNNTVAAEYLAFIECAYRLLQDPSLKYCDISIYGDCSSVIAQLAQRTPPSSEFLLPFYCKGKELLRRLRSQKRSVQLYWVSRKQNKPAHNLGETAYQQWAEKAYTEGLHNTSVSVVKVKAGYAEIVRHTRLPQQHQPLYATNEIT